MPLGGKRDRLAVKYLNPKGFEVVSRNKKRQGSWNLAFFGLDRMSIFPAGLLHRSMELQREEQTHKSQTAQPAGVPHQ